MKTTKTRRRLTHTGSNVVLTEHPDGTKVYEVDEKLARTLTIAPVEVVETKSARSTQSEGDALLARMRSGSQMYAVQAAALAARAAEAGLSVDHYKAREFVRRARLPERKTQKS